MIYIISYLVLYCLSVYLLQRDWRKSFDLTNTDLIVILLYSTVLIGIVIFIGELVSKLLPKERVLLRKYDDY